MSLKYALLGFLNHSSMTGYDLKQHFDRSVRHFWSANLSQIYPALSQMEKDGLLTMEVENQEKHPPRKVYRITGAGRRELKQWLAEPIGLPSLRIPFLVKVFFGGCLEKEEIIALLKDHLSRHRALMDRYLQIRKEIMEHPESKGMEKEFFFGNLTLGVGIKIEQAWIDWLEESVANIEEMNESGVRGGVLTDQRG